MNGPQNPNSQKPISSEEIRQNFHHEKRERYIGTKILVGVGILAILFSIYWAVTKPDNRKKTVAPISNKEQIVTPSKTADVDTVVVSSNTQQPAGKVNPPSQNVNHVVKAIKPRQLHLSVRGNSAMNLREKLRVASERMMGKGNYKPVRSSINIQRFTFQCDFEEVDVSERFKLLSLLWGPLPLGCESCINALSQNPGSEVLIRKTDNVFDYNVISIR